MIKAVSKKISLILVIVILGGLGGIIADRYIFPYLSSTSFFSKYDFLKKSTEDVTVINKTEQVFVKEDTSIGKISGQISASVVNIIFSPAPDFKAVSKKGSDSGVPKNSTGVIVTSDGLIMTYGGAATPAAYKYKVMTSDGSSYDAEFLGTDSYSNLAFLKINAGNLPAIPFGNSNDSTPGEKVIAIGNNLGTYSNRYAAGLLSGFNPIYNLAGTALSFSDKLEGVFETDFNLQDNFTGGPIVDYTGQAIGIIGYIKKSSGVEFFQMPSNKVKKVIDRAIAKELEATPALGVYYIPITKTYALDNNLAVDKGALIYSSSGQLGLAMIAGSPAQKAGVKIQDIITAVNDQEISLENTLPDVLYQFKKGDAIELTILRDGQKIKVPVQL